MPRWGGTDNRSLEYDRSGDRYARFLLEELLPPLEQQYKSWPTRPGARSAASVRAGFAPSRWPGSAPTPSARSSVTAVASPVFAAATSTPALIRKRPAKPLRVFLQTGTQDLDVVFGNWVIANQDMAAALAYQGYDYQFVLGEGGHSLAHGGDLPRDDALAVA